MTSGASVAATVPRAVWIWPKSFVTTWMVAPLCAAQSLATLVTEAVRFASVQMTIVVPALCAATAGMATTKAASAATAAPASDHRRL